MCESGQRVYEREREGEREREKVSDEEMGIKR